MMSRSDAMRRPQDSRGDLQPHGKRRHGYEAPRLEVLGDVRDVTLGATPGIGDSSSPLTQAP